MSTSSSSFPSALLALAKNSVSAHSSVGDVSPPSAQSAASVSTSIVAQFSGQGSGWFHEVRQLYQTIRQHARQDKKKVKVGVTNSNATSPTEQNNMIQPKDLLQFIGQVCQVLKQVSNRSDVLKLLIPFQKDANMTIDLFNWLNVKQQTNMQETIATHATHVTTTSSTAASHTSSTDSDSDSDSDSEMDSELDLFDSDMDDHEVIIPSSSILSLAHISYPCILFTQLINFFTCCMKLRLSLFDFLSSISLTTGHSQGIVAALLISSMKDAQVSKEIVFQRCLNMIHALFWFGLRVSTTQVSACELNTAVRKVYEQIYEENNDMGTPSPMLSIHGLPIPMITQIVQKVNKTKSHPDAHDMVHLSLINGPESVVVSGEIIHLFTLIQYLKPFQLVTSKSPNEPDQSRIPFSQRKFKFHFSFLPINAPFHSSLLAATLPTILQDLKREGILQAFVQLQFYTAQAFQIPIWSTFDQKDLRVILQERETKITLASEEKKGKEATIKLSKDDDSSLASLQVEALMQLLLELQCVLPVTWATTCYQYYSQNITHVLDFGPGLFNSMGRLTAKNLEGTGIQVILVGAKAFKSEESKSDDENVVTSARSSSSTNHHLVSEEILFVSDVHAFLQAPSAMNWAKLYTPQVVPAFTNSLTEKEMSAPAYILQTKYTQVMKRPPIMIAAMTPTTTGEKFVSAVLNAGYTIELAGGGQHTVELFRSRIKNITAACKNGESITVNLLFLNPFLWNMQFPLALQMRREGYPIGCLTIAAGVPALEKASEIVSQCLSAGIHTIGFKPGTKQAISQVVEIAQKHPDMNIILQWTGGRSGGHHSMEDQHWPLLYTYASIRQCSNIILVIGGGIGDTSSAYPYLSGEWSLPFYRAKMPIDAILMGTRVMVAAEAETALPIKHLITRTPGLPLEYEKQWERSLAKDSEMGAGGVLTLLSELGEPIHKIATRATRFWREMDEIFQNNSKEKLKEILTNKEKKKYIIHKLNSDFQKPYFCTKLKNANDNDAESVYELSDMTFYEVARRMIQFMYPPNDPQVNEKPKEMEKQEDSNSKVTATTKGISSQTHSWIDITFFHKWCVWITYIIEKFWSIDTTRDDSATVNEADQEQAFDLTTYLSSPASNPMTLLDKLAQLLPSMSLYTLHELDVDYFLSVVCMLPGKPVNFVPVIDENLKTWLKKDSLWYSENMRSVPENDAQRVVVLQGPISTYYATKVNEPVKDILDTIQQGLIEKFKTTCTSTTDTNAITKSADIDAMNDVHYPIIINVDEKEYSLASNLTDNKKEKKKSKKRHTPKSGSTSKSLSLEHWLQYILSRLPTSGVVAHEVRNWFGLILQSQFIYRNKCSIPSYLLQLFDTKSSSVGKKLQLIIPSAHEVQVVFPFFQQFTTLSQSGQSQDVALPVLIFKHDTRDPMTGTEKISVEIRTPASLKLQDSILSSSTTPVSSDRQYIPLVLEFSVERSDYGSVCLVEEAWEIRCSKIVDFYRQLWLKPTQPQVSEETTISQAKTDDQVKVVDHSTQMSTGAPITAFLKEYISPGCQEITRAEIDEFRLATRERLPQSECGSGVDVPLDYYIVLTWSGIMELLLHTVQVISADLFSLVHLSNEYQLLSTKATEEQATPFLQAGDKVYTKSKLLSVWKPQNDGNTIITIQARIYRKQTNHSDSHSTWKKGAQQDEDHTRVHVDDSEEYADVISKFAIRPSLGDGSSSALIQGKMNELCFKEEEYVFHYTCDDTVDIQLLLNKPWHDLVHKNKAKLTQKNNKKHTSEKTSSQADNSSKQNKVHHEEMKHDHDGHKDPLSPALSASSSPLSSMRTTPVEGRSRAISANQTNSNTVNGQPMTLSSHPSHSSMEIIPSSPSDSSLSQHNRSHSNSTGSLASDLQLADLDVISPSSLDNHKQDDKTPSEEDVEHEGEDSSPVAGTASATATIVPLGEALEVHVHVLRTMHGIVTRGTILTKTHPQARASQAGWVLGNIYHEVSMDLASTTAVKADLLSLVQQLTCPVLDFFQRRAQIKTSADETVFAPTQSYKTLTSIAPTALDSILYGATSQDVNPIHYHPLLACSLARLQQPIVHGMHTSALARQLIAQMCHATSAHMGTGYIQQYRAEFMDMLLPGSTLQTKIRLDKIAHGVRYISLEMRATPPVSVSKVSASSTALEGGEHTNTESESRLVLRAVAQVSFPRTAYLFTGQGSAVVGMGLSAAERASTSASAAAVWTAADDFFSMKYGFKITEIIQTNPRTLTVSFPATEQGAQRRQRYIDLQLLPQSSVATSYTFHSVEGVLFSTQFQQPAILLQEVAAYRDLASRGAIDSSALLAGHSLGEYCALACCLTSETDQHNSSTSMNATTASSMNSSLRSVCALAEVVFLRGLTMQRAVQRDELGRSRYGMVAASPDRVGTIVCPAAVVEDQPEKDKERKQIVFNESALKSLVDEIEKTSGKLLQIVNFNVEENQYVIAGELFTLEMLRLSMNALKTTHNVTTFKSSLTEKDKQPAPSTTAECSVFLHTLVGSIWKQVQQLESASNGGFLPLQRGLCTIPLTGIDVPFHSKLLLDGVVPFRQTLQQTFSNHLVVKYKQLYHMYIPNLLGAPFELSVAFLQQAFALTASSEIASILQRVSKSVSLTEDEKDELARTLLLELLAYQFASPVQWIETQRSLLRHAVQRFIEIGPQSILLPMLRKSLPQTQLMTSQLLFVGNEQNKSIILGQLEEHEKELEGSPEEPEPDQTPASASASAPAPVIAVQAPVVPVAPVAAAPMKVAAAGSSTTAPAVGLTALHIVRLLVSVKLKIPFAQVDINKSIRTLSGGKSALQNEILGDLSAEFSAEPENAAELSLTELAGKLNSSTASFVTKPGKIISTLVNKSLSVMLPGTMTRHTARTYLQSIYGLSTEGAEAIIIHGALALRPEDGSRLSNDQMAQQWLHTAAQQVASILGVSLTQASSGSSSDSSNTNTTSNTTTVVDAKEIKALKAMLSQQNKVLHKYLNASLASSATNADASQEDASSSQDSSSQWEDIAAREYGADYFIGCKPYFSRKLVRTYDDSWSHGRIQAMKLRIELLNGREKYLETEEQTLCRLLKDVAYQKFMLRLKNRMTSDLITFFEDFPFTYQLFLTSLYAEPHYCEVEFSPVLPRTEVTREGKIRLAQGAAIMPRYTLPTYQQTLIHQVILNEKNQHPTKTLSPVITPMYKFVEDMTAEDNDSKIGFRHALAAEQQYNELYYDNLFSLVKHGVSLVGKVVLLTGCGIGSIGFELARCLLASGATIYVTTSQPNYKRWELFRSLYKKEAAKHSSLTVIPFNGASQQDIDSIVQLVGKPHYIFPFAALSENGRDISNIDAHAELAHRTMLVNVIRLIGALTKFKVDETQSVQTTTAHRDADPHSSQVVIAPYTVVILPCSPNHGLFGSDGLYAESKIGLEALFAKCLSEGWGRQHGIGLIGAEIGWTCGTGLMSANDFIAQMMEEQYHLRTFQVEEMAFLLMSLVTPALMTFMQQMQQPMFADFSGGFHATTSLRTAPLPIKQMHVQLAEKAERMKVIHQDQLVDEKIATKNANIQQQAKINIKKKIINSTQKDKLNKDNKKKADSIGASAVSSKPLITSAPVSLHHDLLPPFPFLPTPSSSASLSSKLSDLSGLLDLSTIPVIVGYGEVGPYGDAQARWELELYGAWQTRGAVLLARNLQLIKYHHGKLAKTGQFYQGWIDVQTQTPLREEEIASKYHDTLVQQCGIRPVDPALFPAHYSPSRKLFLQQVALQHELSSIEVSSEAEAAYWKLQHGSAVSLHHGGADEADGSNNRLFLTLKPGAMIYVPKANVFDRAVAGQLPRGWNATKYGIPADIAQSVDRVTLYALAATMDALATAGIKDPYELYQYIHVSEVANCVGSGMGGMKSLRGIFRERFIDSPGLPSDQLQESFINTTAAWLNMLLLSASGPITTPVAACATAAISLSLGVDHIRSGRAKFAVVGGTEDLSEEGMYEFAQMGATANSITEQEAGRLPHEMSRPCTRTRNGFVEGCGASVQLVASAEVALRMGLPIYAVVGLAETACDRQGRSVPAPGVGIVSNVREVQYPTSAHMTETSSGSAALGTSSTTSTNSTVGEHPLLSLERRKRLFDAELQRIVQWRQEELAQPSNNATDILFVETETKRRIQNLQQLYGNRFFENNPYISPLRGSLAVWGLNVNDIDCVSFHGTSTLANDKNESNVLQQQLLHLGRSITSPVPVICQKYLTAHSKGAAAGFMLNGLLQSMKETEGVVPGLRNLDCVDSALRTNHLLLYTDENIVYKTHPIRAALLQSFGFGQAGAQILVVHPQYLLQSSILTQSFLTSYSAARAHREMEMKKHYQLYVADRLPLMPIKTQAPYADRDQISVLTNPLARATLHTDKKEYMISSQALHINNSVNKAASNTKSSQLDNVQAASSHKLVQKLASIETRLSDKTADCVPIQTEASVTTAMNDWSKKESESVSQTPSMPQMTSNLREQERAHLLRTLRNMTLHIQNQALNTNSQDLCTTLTQTDEVLTSPNAATVATTVTAIATTTPIADPAYSSSSGLQSRHSASTASLSTVQDRAPIGVGVDVEEINTFENCSDHFYMRNFTLNERTYCKLAPHPPSAYAGKWCAKESIIKALGSVAAEVVKKSYTTSSSPSNNSLSVKQDNNGDKPSDSISVKPGAHDSSSHSDEAAAPSSAVKHTPLFTAAQHDLNEIEILNDVSGAPYAKLYGSVQQMAQQLGITRIVLSISHANLHAIAMAHIHK